MRKIVLSILLLTAVSILAGAFIKKQQKYKRPKAARAEKIEGIKKLFKKKNIPYPTKILIRVLKDEKKLQLFGKNKGKFELVKNYPICASSGLPGPKRRQGDLQVPEGFYYLNHFNPFSNYHLSMGVSYPNYSDKLLKSAKDPGGAIYIHGDCVTIGCVPITDDLIKELYTIAVDAKDSGQRKIPIHIFPCKFETESCKKLLKKYPQHKDFWKNIEKGYNLFNDNKKLFKVWSSKKGKYIFKK